MQGIYLIENLINGNRYVGQSVDIEARWSYHKSTRFSEYKREFNYPLYRAFRKYEITNFKFTVLEEVEDRTKLTEREQYWYDEMKPEYNILNPREPASGRSKAVYQIDTKTLQIVKEYISAIDAARINNIDNSSISSACRGENHSIGGYHWVYVDDYTPEWKPKQKQPRKRKTKNVLQIDKTTFQPIAKYDSITEAATMNDLEPIQVSNVCNGKSMTAGGYIWTFIPKK